MLQYITFLNNFLIYIYIPSIFPLKKSLTSMITSGKDWVEYGSGLMPWMNILKVVDFSFIYASYYFRFGRFLFPLAGKKSFIE